jgi:hypothetical protein
MNRIRRGAFRAAGVFLLTALTALTPLHTVQAQESPAAVKDGPSQPQVLSYTARYAKATELARILKELMGERSQRMVAIAVDDRTNAIVVTATSARDIEFVSRILRELDRAGADASSPERKLQVFPLRNADLDGPLEGILKVVFADQNGRFAIDPKRKEVIVFADAKTIQTAAEVIFRLDQAAEQRGPEQVQVRLVWLASGPDLEQPAPVEEAKGANETGKPPADLKGVVDELAKLGVEKPHLIAQLIVNTRVGNPFEMQGRAMLGGMCDLQVTGTVSARPGEKVLGANLPNPSFAVNINLNATRSDVPGGGRRGGGFGAPGPQASLCRLQTGINLRAGTSVVLGMTPTDTLTSVFVVQVLLRPETPAGPPAKR